MEQDRFDKLAKKVFEARSRRSVVGGAIAGVVGASAAAITGASAKGDKAKAKAQGKKAKAQGKKGNGKAKGEFVCTATNANQVACTTVACTPGIIGTAFCIAQGCGPTCGAGGFCTGTGFTDATENNACPPNTCCANTPAGVGPACVPVGAQAGSQTCGQVGTGTGVCRTCPAGTRCSGAPNFRCVCDPTSCATGCCISGGNVGTTDDQCVQNGSGNRVNSNNATFNGSFVCGTQGGQCNVCGTPGGAFGGCCTAQGACSNGTANASCGANGQLCEICLNDSTCGVDQACTGATTTTTTTTTVAPTTTLAPCGTTRRGKQKVRCGVGATAPCCARCKSDNSGCKKRRKKN